MHQTLNYKPLNLSLTAADIKAFEDYSKAQKDDSTFRKIVLWAGFVIGILFLIMAISVSIAEPKARWPFAIIIGIFAVTFASSFFLLRHRKKYLARLYKFANANGLRLIYDYKNPRHIGMIFDEGHSRKLKEGFIFKDGLEIANYIYETGSGKNRQTHTWGYMRIKLTRRLPHMVLDSKKNNFLNRFSNLPDSFTQSQQLALEGDFNNYFTLYAPKKYERDALYVFTPDVMAAVIDAGHAYDMEVIDDNLFIYSSKYFALHSENELKSLLDISEKISSELRDQSSYYADERVGDRQKNIIAEPGRRLKTGISTATIIGIIIVILYYVISLIRS